MSTSMKNKMKSSSGTDNRFEHFAAAEETADATLLKLTDSGGDHVLGNENAVFPTDECCIETHQSGEPPHDYHRPHPLKRHPESG